MILQINRLFIVQKTNKFEHKPKGYILLYKKLLKKSNGKTLFNCILVMYFLIHNM